MVNLLHLVIIGLVATAILYGKSDLVLIFDKVVEEIEKKKIEDPASPLNTLKVIRALFKHNNLGKRYFTKFKFTEPDPSSRVERKRFCREYAEGLQDIVNKCTTMDRKTRKRTCHINHAFPYHLVKITYIDLDGKKWKCDLVLRRKDLYVVLFTANGSYHELSNCKDLIPATFGSIKSSLSCGYRGILTDIGGLNFLQAIKHFSCNGLETSRFAVSQNYIQLLIFFVAEAARFHPIKDEIKACLTAKKGWSTACQIDPTNRRLLNCWADLSKFIRERKESQFNSLKVGNRVIVEEEDAPRIVSVLKRQKKRCVE